MKKCIIVLLVLFVVDLAFAGKVVIKETKRDRAVIELPDDYDDSKYIEIIQILKVREKKGNKAIVDLPEFEEGQSFDTTSGKELSLDNSQENNTNRNLCLGFNIDLNISKTKVKFDTPPIRYPWYYMYVDEESEYKETDISMSAYFKWNFGYVEVGPTVGWDLYKFWGASTASYRFKAGIMLDVNFIKNVSGNNIIPGLSLKTQFQRESDELKGFNGLAGLFIKGFVFPTSEAALRCDFGYDYFWGKTDDDITITIHGAYAKCGIEVYF